MNLHLDSNAFRVLIEDIHESTGYRSDVLEKDYYVVLPGVLPKDFSFFDEAPTNAKVKVAYEIMQRQYVLQSSNRIAYPVMIQALDSIKNDLNNNSSWWNAAYEK